MIGMRFRIGVTLYLLKLGTNAGTIHEQLYCYDHRDQTSKKPDLPAGGHCFLEGL